MKSKFYLEVKSSQCEGEYAQVDFYLNNISLVSALQLTEIPIKLCYDVDILDKDINSFRVDVLNSKANFDPVTNKVTEIISAIFSKIAYSSDGKTQILIPQGNQLYAMENYYTEIKTGVVEQINNWVAYELYDEFRFDCCGPITTINPQAMNELFLGVDPTDEKIIPHYPPIYLE